MVADEAAMLAAQPAIARDSASHHEQTSQADGRGDEARDDEPVHMDVPRVAQHIDVEHRVAVLRDQDGCACNRGREEYEANNDHADQPPTSGDATFRPAGGPAVLDVRGVVRVEGGCLSSRLPGPYL